MSFKNMNRKSKSAYIFGLFSMTLYSIFITILVIQLGRSLIKFFMGTIDLSHLFYANIYIIVVFITAPTIISETLYRMQKAKNNEF